MEPSTPDNRVSVKTLRILLLIWLSMLLPVRGAVGAAVMCHQGSPMASGAAATAHAPGHHHEAQDEPGASHHHGHTSPGDHAHKASASTPHASGCNAVTSCCSMTPMLGTLPAIQTPVDATPVRFAPLLAPAPKFQCEAQERPPRST